MNPHRKYACDGSARDYLGKILPFSCHVQYQCAADFDPKTMLIANNPFSMTPDRCRVDVPYKRGLWDGHQLDFWFNTRAVGFVLEPPVTSLCSLSAS